MRYDDDYCMLVYILDIIDNFDFKIVSFFCVVISFVVY